MKETRQSDPVIDRIREVRHEISARFDHDPHKLIDYYMERQKRHQDRLIRATGAHLRVSEPEGDEETPAAG